VVSPLDFYDYPYSHSLLAAFIWSGLFAAFYYMRRRSRRNALVLGAIVMIHWLFDALSHRPDLQLVPGSDVRVGLGLWNSMAATFLVEAGLFVAAVALYARSTKAIDAIGRYAFWSLVILLIVLYFSSLAGPPPPDATTLSVVSFSQWLFIAWGYWINAHRRTGT
jgi:FtsH-binding integral membrane protein